MQRASLLFIVFFSLATTVLSQAYETKITYDKKKQKAFAIDYDYSAETVEKAIESRIQKLGHLGKTEKGIFNRDKGYIVFNDAVIGGISEERLTYLVKVEKGRTKDQSTLYIAINKDGNDMIANMSSKDVTKAKTFLADLLPDVQEAHLEMKIKEQDDAVVKSEKKFKDLQDEKAELQRKTQKNQTDLDSIQKLIESQRHVMDSLKSQRRPAL